MVRDPAADPAVDLRGVTKDYGGVGVFDLDLRVERGEVVGFLGPNGAGKSTTIRVVLDLVRPEAGTVRVLGLDPRAAGPQVRARLGFLPSDLAVWGRATARQALDHLARLRGGVDPAWTGELCRRLDVDLDRPLRTLSTGNRQKVGLVQALAHRPDLVVLDEPTMGLDPLVQQEVQRLLRETADEGRTVLLSSHTLSEVERVADRVAVLRRGRLVAVERVAALKQVAVRRVRAELDREPDAGAFRRLQGVRDVVVDGRRLEAVVEGHVDALVKELARSTVVSLDVEEADLEEVFLAMYAGDGRAAAGCGGGDGAAAPGHRAGAAR
ncbi:ABC transporter ATP-binding protein [uncultured Pseudokineococcus sp.]|uniref:ABC transporter ATP-binding protein n=1 Tax=uncultured Pseudokineococcus sp. TaxID=1642928 RepID=UPI00260B7914|nr:ABC transporter ATP-binding protein [uncultured Pseudokineococcus sp.]